MSEARPALLIVDDDVEYLQALDRVLRSDFSVSSACSVDEARRLFVPGVDLVLLDVRLTESDTGDRDGLQLLQSMMHIRRVPVVMMTAYGDVDLAVDAMKAGAADFVQKGRLDLRELKKVLTNALERSRLEQRVEQLEEEIHRLEPWELIGQHRSIRELRETIDMVANDGYSSVLIRGETGTGKEVVARAIHSRGWRRHAPFVPVALPALSPTLVERELFGHAKGAFTDARESRPGYIQKSSGGVLFLDEIGELTLELQPKLLRVLDTRSFTPIGSTSEVSVDVQVVCATNRDLEAMRDNGFRQDLYYRLRTVEIVVPPLRERLEDVSLLADHFLAQFRSQGRTPIRGLSPGALQRLQTYPFPGNVRELRALIERAMMLAGRQGRTTIEAADLPAELGGVRTDGDRFLAIDLDAELARTELSLIERALDAAEGRKSDAWRILGLNDRFALRRRVKTILEHHPALLNLFPLIRSRYGDQAERG